MLSLDNVFNEEELTAFDRRIRDRLTGAGITADRVRYWAEPKLDGAAVSLRYERGELVFGATPVALTGAVTISNNSSVGSLRIAAGICAR